MSYPKTLASEFASEASLALSGERFVDLSTAPIISQVKPDFLQDKFPSFGNICVSIYH